MIWLCLVYKILIAYSFNTQQYFKATHSVGRDLKMKTAKIFTLAMITFFVLSNFVLIAQALVECPRCHGTGKISSSSCYSCGGSGFIQPSITRTSLLPGGNSTHTIVGGIFRNNEDVEVYGVATATLNTQIDQFTNTTERISIPANSEKTITVPFKIPEKNYFSRMISFTAEAIACPVCEGTGAGSLVDCPDCDGTGYIEQSAIEGINFGNVGLPIIGVAVVAAVFGFGYFVFKQRRITESKVRTFTSSEFQTWVIERLHGTAATVLDSRKGIDGFTGDGTPIVAKQSDSIGKFQIDSFLNSVMQAKAKRGIFVAFGFDKEANLAVVRGRMNYRIDIKLVTVKELLERSDPLLI